MERIFSLLNVTENISTECVNHCTDTDQVENGEHAHAGISLEAIQHVKNNKSPGSDHQGSSNMEVTA